MLKLWRAFPAHFGQCVGQHLKAVVVILFYLFYSRNVVIRRFGKALGTMPLQLEEQRFQLFLRHAAQFAHAGHVEYITHDDFD